MSSAPARVCFPPVGQCIYCNRTENLSDEHIIPFALNGYHIVPKASCDVCASITKKFEQTVARKIFGGLRIRHGFKTRHKKDRPTELPVRLSLPDGGEERRMVPAADFPGFCFGLRLPSLPGILHGKPPDWNPPVEPVFAWRDEDIKPFVKNGHKLNVDVPEMPFVRQLAKIAHSYAVAKLGVSSFRPLLLDLILSEAIGPYRYLVGGDAGPVAQVDTLHRMEAGKMFCSTTGKLYVVARLHLFARIGMPRYIVVVGEDVSHQIGTTHDFGDANNIELFVTYG